MLCLKCGRETIDEQIFCDGCLQTMARYPIKPGTAIHLPRRDSSKKPAPRKRVLSAEEQVQMLKQTVKRLIIAIAILTVVLCLTTVSLIHNLFGETAEPITGQNYSIDTSQAP